MQAVLDRRIGKAFKQRVTVIVKTWPGQIGHDFERHQPMKKSPDCGVRDCFKHRREAHDGSNAGKSRVAPVEHAQFGVFVQTHIGHHRYTSTSQQGAIGRIHKVVLNGPFPEFLGEQGCSVNHPEHLGRFCRAPRRTCWHNAVHHTVGKAAAGLQPLRQRVVLAVLNQQGFEFVTVVAEVVARCNGQTLQASCTALLQPPQKQIGKQWVVSLFRDSQRQPPCCGIGNGRVNALGFPSGGTQLQNGTDHPPQLSFGAGEFHRIQPVLPRKRVCKLHRTGRNGENAPPHVPLAQQIVKDHRLMRPVECAQPEMDNTRSHIAAGIPRHVNSSICQPVDAGLAQGRQCVVHTPSATRNSSAQARNT